MVGRVLLWQAIPLEHGPQTVGPDPEFQESGHATCPGTTLLNVYDQFSISHVPGKGLHLEDSLSWAPP